MKIYRYILLFCALVLSGRAVSALVVNGTPDPNWLNLSSESQTTEGNDFWLTYLTHNATEPDDPSLNLVVYAVADSAMTIDIAVGTNRIGSIAIPAGGGEGKFVISPSSMAYLSATMSQQPTRRGVHVYSTDRHARFSCYAYSEAGFGQGTTRDASLVLPTRTLGKEYFVQTFQTDSRATEFAVVATEDNTSVTITPKVQTSTGSPAGQAITLTLQKGDVYQVRSLNPSEISPGERIDLSGSSVCASKPVAVFQGNESVKIATGSLGSYSVNHAFEQTLPVSQWGTEYYIGLTAHAFYNFYNILAAYDNTRVTISGHSQPIILNAGQTIDEAEILYNISESLQSTDVKIVSDKPVFVNAYLSCGGANHNAAEIINGRPIPTNWGNSTSTMVPSWESRVKQMSFFTDTIANETETGVGHMYVQVVAKSTDTGRFTLDGAAVPSSAFAALSADGSMSVANIELADEGRHTLESTGEGFTGFVYTITSEARAYQYTLGFTPKSHDDSLYIANTERVMGGGYNVERVDGKGWYQRQQKEWIESRLDTASVCDSTELVWRVETPADTLFRVDSIHWTVTNSDTLVFEKDTIIARGNTVHEWAYTFGLPEEVKEARITSLEYKVQALLYRTPLLCDELLTDTLQSVVRVHTLYNDTVWKVLCEGEECDFFTDSVFTASVSGNDTITRSYTSAGGCDSLSTLVLYVCQSVSNTLDTTLCEKDLTGLNLGYFFQNTGFTSSFNNRTAPGSPWVQDQGYWLFDRADTLHPASCSNDVQDYINHGAVYTGCDSILHLRLRVLATHLHHNDISICSDTYIWRDDANNEIRTIAKSAENYNTPCTYTHSVPYSNGGCDSVRYELTLTFVDGDLATDTIRLCRNAAPVTPSHKGVTWDTFDPSEHETGTFIHGDTKWFSGDGGCSSYPFQFIFWVDPLPTHRDTVVYCYEEGQTRLHQWPGHDSFWYKEKGSSVQTRTGNFISSFPSLAEGRKIYELSDTVRASTEGDCDDAYYQVVIFMPHYTIHSVHHMADIHACEWNGKLLAGEHVQTDTLSNPKGLEVVVMKPEGGVYPSGWEVRYDPVLKEYTLTDSVLTKVIHDANGTSQQCDSVNSLSLRVGQIFRDTTFSFSPSNKVYTWRGKPLSLPQVTEPTEVFFHDSLKTRWPVTGLDSVYTLSLTVFPAYSYDTAVSVCQDSTDYLWPRHRTIAIDHPGHYTLYDSLETAPRIYRHPKTQQETVVVCDSIWTLDLTVNTVYNADYSYIEHVAGLKSNDTLTFHSPKTLFIGEDFDYAAHGNKTAEELREEAGADAVEIVTADSLYAKTALSAAGCDSTTYLRLSLCRLAETFLTDTIGDNDSLWVFGGDTTMTGGQREHTLPFIHGTDFNVADNGDPIDYSSPDRTVRLREYVDTLHTAAGCDSIVHMTLRIFPSYRIDTAATICGNNADFTWHGKTHLNKLVGDNETGIVYVYDSLKTTASGAKVDSVHIMELTIYPGEWSRTTRTLCYNDTILWHGLQLQYDPEELINEVVHEFKDDASECGRVIYMTPVFNPSYGYGGAPDYNNWVENIHLCQDDDFTWRGKPVSTARVGDFTVYDSLKTVGCNCDSIYTLHYRVDTTYRYYTEGHLCSSESYEWYVNGVLYHTYTATSASDIYDTIKGQSVLGCDSSYYLHLHVDSTYHIHVEETLCPTETGSFSWNGKSYDAQLSDARTWSEPREFHDTLRTTTVLTGCDSTRYLHLTILPAQDSVWRDTICESESYLFYGRTLSATGTYTETRPNRYGCAVDYRVMLEVVPPTRFTVTTDPLCFDPSAMNSYPLYYTYAGANPPLMYNIYYGEEAKALGFEDLHDLAVPAPADQHAGVPVSLDIEVPSFEPLQYPTPGRYPAVIGFDNGVCDGDTLMQFPFVLEIDYPSWIMEQHHNDLIALLNEEYNGGYTWSRYQWYEGDSMLVGQTKPYLYIPTGLKAGVEYHVSLTREGETVSYPVCPIVARSAGGGNEYAPTMGYLSVTPTCVHAGNPLVNILSRKDGTYRVTTSGGRLVTQGVFRAPVTPLTLPVTEGMYVIQLWSNDTPEEPYRAIKVIVSQSCPNCDISSF